MQGGLTGRAAESPRRSRREYSACGGRLRLGPGGVDDRLRFGLDQLLCFAFQALDVGVREKPVVLELTSV